MSISKYDIFYMGKLFEVAKIAGCSGDVPVAAMIVIDDAIISYGHNRKEEKSNPTLHAEILAMEKASQIIGDWRLYDATLYTTLEPCVMCAGAILHFRVGRVVFGITEPKFGGVVSKANLFDIKFNHKVEYDYGIFEDELKNLMKDFFKKLRCKDI